MREDHFRLRIRFGAHGPTAVGEKISSESSPWPVNGIGTLLSLAFAPLVGPDVSLSAEKEGGRGRENALSHL